MKVDSVSQPVTLIYIYICFGRAVCIPMVLACMCSIAVWLVSVC